MITTIIIYSSVSFCSGCVIGYYLHKKILDIKKENIINKEFKMWINDENFNIITTTETI